jgi:uncharacterized membrane protein YgcG
MTLQRDFRRAARVVPIAVLLSGLGASGTARADQVVQVPVDELLDGRPVSTLTGGVVVPWTVGIDQNDGFMTAAAAASLKQTGVALPDDGTFAADAAHPEVVLHFSNAAPATRPQAHLVRGAGNIAFAVPRATYSKMFLFLTSSYGDSALTATLGYADGTTSMSSFTLPDWGTGAPLPKNPPIFFNLISGLHKWDAQDMSVDTPTHALAGVELTPAMNKMLTSVRITKAGATQYLIFWGATGIATSVPDGGPGSEDGGAAGAGGADGGDAASEGTTGAGGASGGGGSGGATGVGGAPGVGDAAVGDAAADDAMPSDTPTSDGSGHDALGNDARTGSHPDAPPGAGCACAFAGRDPVWLAWSLWLAIGIAARRRLRR